MINCINTKDLCRELESLESEYKRLVNTTEVDSWLEEYGEQLTELRKLQKEIPEFDEGVTLILYDDFENYVYELGSDILPTVMGWPLNHIDWTQAASELENDYSRVEYQGETFLFRS